MNGFRAIPFFSVVPCEYVRFRVVLCGSVRFRANMYDFVLNAGKEFFATNRREQKESLFELKKLQGANLPLNPPMLKILEGETSRATSAPWHCIFLGLAKTLFRGIIATALSKMQFGTEWTTTIEALLKQIIFVPGSNNKATQLPSWLKLKPYKIFKMYQSENWLAITKIIPKICETLEGWASSFTPGVTIGTNAYKYEKYKSLENMLMVFHEYCKQVMSHVVTVKTIVLVKILIQRLLESVVVVEDLFKLKKTRTVSNQYGKPRKLESLPIFELKVRILKHELLTDEADYGPEGSLHTKNQKVQTLKTFYRNQPSPVRVNDDEILDNKMRQKDLEAAQWNAENAFNENNSGFPAVYEVNEEIMYRDPTDQLVNLKRCRVTRVSDDIGSTEIEIDVTGLPPHKVVHLANVSKIVGQDQNNADGDGEEGKEVEDIVNLMVRMLLMLLMVPLYSV